MTNDDELTSVSRPCGLFREFIKGEIKKILLSEDILVEISIDWYSQPTFTTQSWQKYWEPVTPFLSPVILNILDNLGKARSQYILTKFSHHTMTNYCFNYFCLLEEFLNIILKKGCDKKTKSALLGKVLGFENFAISWANGENRTACGTSTIRNPCYLLSKIKLHQVQDDPKFLALITGPNIACYDEAGIYVLLPPV
jgi:hypothetical protein